MMAEGESQVPESGHPTIIVDHELERMCDEAALSLECRPELFQSCLLYTSRCV